MRKLDERSHLQGRKTILRTYMYAPELLLQAAGRTDARRCHRSLTEVRIAISSRIV